ncbi:MAG TPA: hypothetical protein VKN14_02140 [Flavobacteriaceae bacterium]|nr:hypothetical protein [Flavobacteriaceae bacterium]
MKTLKLLILLSLMLIISACSSDDNLTEDISYFKGRRYADLDLINEPPEVFYYNNGKISSVSGFSFFEGDYSYDEKDNLIGKSNFLRNPTVDISYEYDSQKRLIKEFDNETGNYYQFNYDSNKITVYYFDEELIAFSQLTVDDNGKIVEFRDLNNGFFNGFSVEKYVYDNKGNIIEIKWEENVQGNPDEVSTLLYDQNKNPYFYTLKDLYKSIYYSECKNGIPSLFHGGFTPNNITKQGLYSYSYEYNDEGYPIYCINQIIDTEYIYDYYE